MSPLRLGLSILAGLVTVALIWWVLHSVGFRFDPFHTKERAVEKAAVATEHAASSTEAVKQIDHFTNTVTVIREKQDAAVQSVQSAPGATEAIPEGVLSGWRSGIDGMREPAPAAGNRRP